MRNEIIQDYEKLCPEVNRRTLQRDLKELQDKELVATEGATNQLSYVLLILTCDIL
jgi:DNA-binding HxlR family transcriptional regulator